MNIITTLLGILSNWKNVVKGICVASVALLLFWGINTHNTNKKLSQELEMAQNNIEAYQELLDSSQQANNVLRLDFQNIQQQNDKTLHKLDSISKKLKIKPKTIYTAATQSQSLNVKDSKGVQGVTLKDSIIKDSIQFNPQTIAHYTITPDSVTISLDITNDQYLYVYSTREYKNKKSFIKRLFTLDFKKITKDRYQIYNSNDAIKSGDVRVVKTTEN